jgi:threonine dehydrogenase-like Zn-dependent dehydrogenase
MPTAKTVRYEPDGSISLIEVDVPDPGPGEVQLEGGACGICSWDIATCKLGEKMSPVAPPGHEGVGYVRAVGPDVEQFAVGDRVAGGGFSTVRNLPVKNVYKIPDSPLADEFWIVEPVSCVVTGLDHCDLRAGDRVAVVGSGFMGLMLLQGLVHSFAEQVVAIDVSAARLALAKQVGVAEIYDVGEIGAESLLEQLKPREFDTVVDTTGSQAGLDLSTDLVKRGGRINLFGWLKGKQATFDPTKWHAGGFTVVNSSPSAKLRDPFPPAIRLMERGVIDLQPLVTHVVNLDDYPELMRSILAGEPSYVKGVIRL